MAWVTWMHSSRVGVRTRAWTSLTSGSMVSSSGGTACSWMGLGDSYPTSSSASRSGPDNPSSVNVVMFRSRLGARVEQQLATGAPLGQRHLGLRHLLQPVGRAD